MKWPANIWKYIGGLAAFGAATAGILTYLAPQSYPVILAPELYACPESLSDQESKDLKQFFDALHMHKNRVVYISHLLVGIGGCALFGNHGSGKKTSNLIKAIGPEGSKTLTLTYRSLYGGSSENYFLIIHLGLEDYPFATSNCDENCVGADGIYQAKITSNEGNIFIDLARAPIVDSVTKSYDCSISQLNSTNAWQRFWACKL